MKLLIAFSVFFMTEAVRGATLLNAVGLLRPLEYNANMTSMWTMDQHGHITEDFLQAPSSTNKLSLGKVNAETDVLYYLYTKESNSAYQLIKGDLDRLQSSTFDPSKPTKIAIHGYKHGYLSEAVQLIRQAYLKNNNVNIIGVDWSALAKGPWYPWAADNTKVVGQQIGQLIDWLVSVGARVEDFHIIGHSLGAHTAAFAANYVTSGTITRISGIDPALPLFGGKEISERLDPSDADVVDCIHTCGGYLGFYNPLCTHDFYPNGGKPAQPGCTWDLSGSCSHLRAVLLFAESVETEFKAELCDSMQKLKNKKCNSDQLGVMGDPAVKSPPGVYYLSTKAQSPYVE